MDQWQELEADELTQGDKIEQFNNLIYDYKNLYVEYSNEIVARFESELFNSLELKNTDIKLIEFESLKRPREYNFTTDSIHVEIIFASENVNKITEYLRVNRETFQKYLQDRYTPRSGFIPFHSNEAAGLYLIENSLADDHKAGSILQFILTKR